MQGTTRDGQGFTQPYDRLLIATGASAVKPALPGADLPGVHRAQNAGGRAAYQGAARRRRRATGDRPRDGLRRHGDGRKPAGARHRSGHGQTRPGLHALARSGTRRGRPRGAWRPRDRGSHRPPAAAHRGRGRRACGGLPRCDAQRTDGARRRRRHPPGAAWRRRPGWRSASRNSIAVDRTLAHLGPGHLRRRRLRRRLPCRHRPENLDPARAEGQPRRLGRGGQRLRGKRSRWTGSPERRFSGCSAWRWREPASTSRRPGKPVSSRWRRPSHSSTKAHSFPGASALWVSAVGDRKTGRLLGMQIVGREGAAHRINGAPWPCTPG